MRDLLAGWFEKYLGYENGRAGRVLTVLSIVFLIVIWVASIGWGFGKRTDFLRENSRVLDRHRAALEMQAQGIFKPAEVFLRIADQWLLDHPTADPRTDPEFGRLVSEFQKSTNNTALIRLVAADGALYLVPFSPNSTTANVADREYFQAAMGGPAGQIHLGLTFKGRVTGRQAIPLALKLTQPRSGVVVIFAHMDLEPLLKTLSQHLPGPGASLMILRRDGKFLAEAPGESERRRSLAGAGTEWLKGLDAGHHAGVDLYHDATGAPHWLAWGATSEFSLITVIIESHWELLIDWRDQMMVLAIFLIATTAGVLVVRERSVSLLNALGESQATLRRMATTDALTGVSNRHLFSETGAVEFERARRYGRPLALLVFDIDYFKKVNDQYGHIVGDGVLQMVAIRCQKLLRDQDTLARCGGEEFAVILPETDSDRALSVGERIRQAVEATAFEVDGAAIGVTVSVGVTELIVGDSRFDQVYGRADVALYRAKTSGRNQVIGA